MIKNLTPYQRHDKELGELREMIEASGEVGTVCGGPEQRSDDFDKDTVWYCGTWYKISSDLHHSH